MIENFYNAYGEILDQFKDYIGKCIARTQELLHYLENGRTFYAPPTGLVNVELD